MGNDTSGYPDFVFVACDIDESADIIDLAVAMEAGSLVRHPVKYVRHDLARPAPAATDTGLVTVAKQWKVTAKNWSGLKPEISEPFDERELVTRSQAVELLAAERAEKERLADDYQAIREQLFRGWRECQDLKADNAALIHDLNRIKDHETELVNDNAAQAARIKELDRYLETASHNAQKYAKDCEALEAKLAAAKQFIQFCADGFFVTDDELRGAARALLGGKPS